MVKLDACPHCGGTGELVEDQEMVYYGGAYYGRCTVCKARGPSKKTMDEAREAWNKRTSILIHDGAVVRSHTADPYQEKLAGYWQDFRSWNGGGRHGPHDDQAERYADSHGAIDYETVAFMAMVAGREWENNEKKGN